MSEQDFLHALELYRTNLVQYRVTGRTEYKTAYENAESWINTYLNGITDQITDGKTFVDGFLQNYSTANPDMDKLKTRFAQIRKEGPEAQDTYMTIRRINEQGDVPIDMTAHYVKAGVLVALIGAIAVLSVF
jgi:succinate dehydrogenase/fumarate reductase flavoprotein subunit